MKKYSVLFSYVGTDFCGWQKQKGSAAEGKPSIQRTIEQVLAKITNEAVIIVGSGRTDSGVHAVGQVAHFILRDTKVWETKNLRRGMNSILPLTIRAMDVREVEIDFHAQHSAEKKQYSYYFQQGASPVAHLAPFSRWIHKRLDVEAMNQGLKYLIGEHDFKPFQGAGSKPGSTVREILEAEVTTEKVGFPMTLPTGGPGALSQEISLVRVRVLGTGFLKQMVRGIAGTLLQVGESRRPAECFRDILKSQNRDDVGPTAPARALWLEKVWYPEKYDLWR
jgi:tRNA pseudouridine38-40 synthase